MSEGVLILREAGGKVIGLNENEHKIAFSFQLNTNSIIHCDVINILGCFRKSD